MIELEHGVLVRMGGANEHGYCHCMPYGKDVFVLRVSPRHPGYVMTVCADTVAARARRDDIIVDLMLVNIGF